MTVKVLTGSKEKIAEDVTEIPGDVREVIVFVDDEITGSTIPESNGDIFHDMAPFTVAANNVEYSRQASYARNDD